MCLKFLNTVVLTLTIAFHERVSIFVLAKLTCSQLDRYRMQWQVEPEVELYSEFASLLKQQLPDYKELELICSNGLTEIENRLLAYIQTNPEEFVIIIDDRKVTPPNIKDAKKLKQKAQKFYYQSDTKLPQAIQAYRDYLAIAPNDDEAWGDLAILYMSKNDDTTAIKCIDRAIAINSKKTAYWSRKQICLQSLYREKIKNIYTKRGGFKLNSPKIDIKLYPEIDRIGRDLIECYRKVIEGFEEAELDLKHILEKKYQLADVLTQQGDYTNAIEILEMVFDNTIENNLYIKRSNVAFLLARAYQGATNHEKAMHFIDIFLEQKPEFDFLYIHKVNAWRLMGNAIEADAILTNILEKIDREISKMQKEGRLQAYIFYQKAGLLENYRENYLEAANCLQEIVDRKLYYSEDERTRLISNIAAFCQR